MIEVTVLGTSGSSPALGRQMPAVALRYNGEVLLFDCGEGTQMQMLRYGINAFRVKAIFVTHVHGDHVIGIAGLVRSLALNGRNEELLIFVPKGYEKIISNLVSFDKTLIDYPITIKGAVTGIVYKGKGFAVSALRLNHSIPTLGYVFKEDDKRRFLKGKCESLGIEGTVFKTLEEKGSIRLNGKRITLASVTTLHSGKKIVYASDTRPTSTTVKASAGADVLIHESSYTEAQKVLAASRKHSTALEAAQVAKKAKVKLLVLTHFSTRYKTTGAMVSEAKAVFGNTVAASDGYKITV